MSDTPRNVGQSLPLRGVERQLTTAPHGHILTNAGIWSPDGDWIVYDVRSDPAGSVFDGTRIERVNVRTGEVRLVYESANGACCAVASYSPTRDEVVFILGPEHPTSDFTYGPASRRGVIVNADQPGSPRPLDARDLVAPFTPGALRGGTHLHAFSGDRRWAAFTYHDRILAGLGDHATAHDLDQRNVGVSAPAGRVVVSGGHPRNHDGDYFSVLVTRTVNNPRPGSDEIRRGAEEAWVGTHGYRWPDGSRQRRALAFPGEVISAAGVPILEAFIVDVPDDVTLAPDDGPLQGTPTRRPLPPRGTRQRRLTRTESRRHPGLAGPRHWLRSAPDGSYIAMLMKDDGGIVQLFTVAPAGDEPPRQVTGDPWPIASAFTWSPDGRLLAYVADNSIFVADATTGRTARLTPRSTDADAPRPEACVFAPDGKRVAYVRQVTRDGVRHNQVFVVTIE